MKYTIGFTQCMRRYLRTWCLNADGKYSLSEFDIEGDRYVAGFDYKIPCSIDDYLSTTLSPNQFYAVCLKSFTAFDDSYTLQMVKDGDIFSLDAIPIFTIWRIGWTDSDLIVFGCWSDIYQTETIPTAIDMRLFTRMIDKGVLSYAGTFDDRAE